MGYIIASFIAIFVTTLIVYKVANSLFGLGLRLKPILLCAICAMLISLVLPKIIVGFAGLPATVAVLAIFAVVFAYFVARYEDMPQPNAETDAQSEQGCDFGDMLAVSASAAADAETFDEPGSSPQSGEIGGNASSRQAVSGEAGVLASGQEMSSLFEPETTGNNLNKGQLPPKEEILNDTQVSSNDKESGIVQTDINTMSGDTTTVVEDNSPESQHIDEQENVTDLPEVGSVNEIQEPDTIEETEVVEFDLQEVELAQKEERSSLDDVQSVLVSAVEPAGTEEPESVLDVENINLEEDQQAEEVNVNNSDDRDSLVAAKIIENELKEQTDEAVVDENYYEDVFTELDLNISTEIDHSELRVENTDTVATNYEDNANEMNDIVEVSEQLEAEVSVQMPNEEITGQVESSVAQAFVQEVDDNSMKHDELNVNPVQLETEELDNLIDHAFVCKETQDYNNAYKSFKKALALYPNSEAAPFLVVEIGNILKNKGDYDEAIKIFSEGRNLSQTKHDEMMEQEFISTIAYLRITKNILLQNRFGNIPFLEIPTQILNQIDEEFREWRNVGNI